MHGLAVDDDGAIQRRDNALGDGAAECTQGVTDDDCLCADGKLGGIAEYRNRQIGGFDLQERDIDLCVGTDQLCVITVAAAGRDLDRACARNHMVIGNDITVLADDNAGTRALRDILTVELAGLHDLGGDLYDGIRNLVGDRLSRFISGLIVGVFFFGIHPMDDHGTGIVGFVL